MAGSIAVLYLLKPNLTNITPQTQKDLANIPLLKLPFNISDIDNTHAEINPLGVVRFSKDLEEVGHSGIDVPMKQKSNIYAVADGEIVLIESTGDDWGGMKIFQLLKKDKEGEGVGFIYDHVTPATNLKVGSKVTSGQVIAYKTAPRDFTAHFQLSRLFNNYKYIDNILCWPDYLDKEEKTKLYGWWDEYKKTDVLVSSWRENIEEGKYPFRELLDASKYPNGPQLCYPLGTDVR